jgi:hypothetical protein
MQGQIVDVRNRRFVVTEVSRANQNSDVLPDALVTSSSKGRLDHWVTLSSLEDDALGEELQVIWELEPGARAYDKIALPSPRSGSLFDAPRQLNAFLDAVRWGAIASADVQALQSPFRSGIDIQDYQLDPVARALRMPRVSLLIADDVGLGKTSY